MPLPMPPVGVELVFVMNADRQAAILSLMEIALTNSFTSRMRVSVGAISDISRTWDGRLF